MYEDKTSYGSMPPCSTFNRVVCKSLQYVSTYHMFLRYVFTSVGEKEVSLQEIRSGFEFVPELLGIALRGGYSYGAWPRTVLITIEFKFIVPEL